MEITDLSPSSLPRPTAARGSRESERASALEPSAIQVCHDIHKARAVDVEAEAVAAGAGRHEVKVVDGQKRVHMPRGRCAFSFRNATSE